METILYGDGTGFYTQRNRILEGEIVATNIRNGI